MRLTFARNLTN